ncbi:hypothetical protein GCM10010401_18090 [Rarobacter faecitabidus]|uniref:CBS domain-containing protein n=1 Tax=Rarobacter faecitabidus TaxID=13243 RepID=A0A542ZUP5_RARFA|nr:hypothetical protein [Rarobacter faecitabidus]TQL64019.1 hypothetical protein FB461_0504 [Rarobacter faecitabidus]
MGIRTEQFASELIAATDAIEAELRAGNDLERVHGLGAVTRAAIAAGDPVATHYGIDLWRLSSHRESVAHQHHDAPDPMGILDGNVVARAERILQEIRRPSRAIRFASSAIARAASGDALGPWLAVMREREISQIPVYDNGTFAGLLTTNGIARWLALHVDDNGDALIEEARVRDVLSHVESYEVAVFLPVTVSVAEAIATLSPAAGPKVVILTASGRDTDPPQGLLVRSDLGELQEALAL